MAEFRKSGGFGGKRPGGYRSGGDRPPFARKSFGNSRREDSGPREMFSATCVDCGKFCEVPFRPSAGRPVFCKDCFDGQREGGGRPERHVERRFDAPRHFEKRETSFAPPAKPGAPDARMDDMKRALDAVNKKLDAVIGMIEGIVIPTTEKTHEDHSPKDTKKILKNKPGKK